MGMFKRLGFKGSFILLLFIVLLLLAFQNMDTISIRFLFWDVILIKKIYFIFLLVGIGWILGFFGGLSFRENSAPISENDGCKNRVAENKEKNTKEIESSRD